MEYDQSIKELEKEILRKFKAGEDPAIEVHKAAGLKLLKEECVRMMVEKRDK